MTKTKALKILAVGAVVMGAYKSSDWYASASDHFQWHSEHYSVGYGLCYNCFRYVQYWQEKGRGPRGVESVCEYCGLTNTYMQDTLPNDNSNQPKPYYSAGKFACWNCKKDIELWQDKGKVASDASVKCWNCGFISHHPKRVEKPKPKPKPVCKVCGDPACRRGLASQKPDAPSGMLCHPH